MEMMAGSDRQNICSVPTGLSLQVFNGFYFNQNAKQPSKMNETMIRCEHCGFESNETGPGGETGEEDDHVCNIWEQFISDEDEAGNLLQIDAGIGGVEQVYDQIPDDNMPFDYLVRNDNVVQESVNKEMPLVGKKSCGRKAIGESVLKADANDGSHTSKMPFRCEICSKNFVSKTNLKLHLRRHRGETPYSCSICGKGFFQKTHLTSHHLVHTGEKPFKCNVCGTKFTQKSSLKLHNKTMHAGMKPRQGGELQGNTQPMDYSFKNTETVQEIVPKELPELSLAIGYIKQEEEEFPDNQQPLDRLVRMDEIENGMVDEELSADNEKGHAGEIFGKAPPQKSGVTKVEREPSVKTSFKCEKCDKSFASKANLKLHLRRHRGETPYVCSICGKGFFQKIHLNSHYLVHTGEKPFECQICGKKLTQKSALKLHNERMHACMKPYESSTFVEFTSNAEKVGKLPHTDMENSGARPENGELKCNVQPGDSSVGDINVEQEIVNDKITVSSIINGTTRHEDKGVQANEQPMDCLVRNNHITEEKVNKKRVIADKILPVCKICGRAFTRKKDVRRHERVHTGEKPFKCEICDKSFTQKESLKVHLRSHSGERPYICTICGSRFSRKASLISHNLVHTGEKPFACDVCGQAFGQASTLRRHKRIHTGAKPYECSTCGSKFPRGRDLQVHKFTHMGETPFECKLCEKFFTRKETLERHMNIHIGEKNFKCDFCGKAFMHKSNLAEHINIHTGKRAHKCDVCGKAFTQRSNLKTHQRIHSGSNILSC